MLTVTSRECRKSLVLLTQLPNRNSIESHSPQTRVILHDAKNWQDIFGKKLELFSFGSEMLNQHFTCRASILFTHSTIVEQFKMLPEHFKRLFHPKTEDRSESEFRK